MGTVIIADSRGAGLKKYLDSRDAHGEVTVLAHPGSGYEMAVIKSLTSIREIKPDLVIVVVGICDLTTRNKVTKYTGLRYSTVAANVDHVISSAKSSFELLRNMGTFKISYATMTGLDIEDYNYPQRRQMNDDEYRYYCSKLKPSNPDQLLLNASVLEVNRQLMAINKCSGTQTTWVGGIVHAYFKHTNHHHYIRLIDGCHLNENTKRAWALQLGKSIKRILKK